MHARNALRDAMRCARLKSQGDGFEGREEHLPPQANVETITMYYRPYCSTQPPTRANYLGRAFPEGVVTQSFPSLAKHAHA